MKNELSARVFNIERYATEDGPGIRTTVFLKGCNLRCKWCANPESQDFKKEILFKSVKCVGCGRCEKLCPHQAISFWEGFGMITDPNKCKLCLKCVDGCYADARVLQGEDMTVSELMEVLRKDAGYYAQSGGGITFSGGEPLLYADFIKEAAKEIHKEGWSVLTETCGDVDLENIQKVYEDIDIIFCDYKHFDSKIHKELTGSDNKRIIDNIIWLNDNFKGEMFLRYPFIPGCNDDTRAVEEFLKFASGLKLINEVVFLPYHRLGLPKYQGLGREYAMGDTNPLKPKDLEYLKEYEKDYNLKITIQ